MHVMRTASLAGLALIAVSAFGLPVLADTAPAAPTNAVGAGSAWNASVDSSGNVEGQTFSEAQLAQISKINSYFNGFDNIAGTFLQTDSQQRQAKGKLYVKRPGKFRFVYAPPSKLVILSDGRFLSIEDYALKTVDRYNLDSTPFRLLLAQNVDLLRDGRVIDMYEGADVMSLTVEDAADKNSGRIKLFFKKASDGNLLLSEWVITDAQGLDTRIEVAELTTVDNLDPKLFKNSDIGLPGVYSNR